MPAATKVSSSATPEPLGHLGVVPARLLLHVDTDQPHRHPFAQPGVRREGQVGVAAAEVDHAQRVLGGGRAQLAGCACASSMAAESARRNSSTWRYFACRDGLTRPWRVGDAERHAGPGGPRAAVAPWPGRGRAPAPTGSVRSVRVQQRLPLLGHPQLVGVGGGLDVPVGERLLEQFVEDGRAASAWLDTCAWVSSYAVTWRRRPALRSTYRSSTRRQRGSGCPRRRPEASGAHEVLVVEHGAAQPGQRREKRFGHAGAHYFTRAAITTIRISPPSATGMTSRR